jgi:hypothetical protein
MKDIKIRKPLKPFQSSEQVVERINLANTYNRRPNLDRYQRPNNPNALNLIKKYSMY